MLPSAMPPRSPPTPAKPPTPQIREKNGQRKIQKMQNVDGWDRFYAFFQSLAYLSFGIGAIYDQLANEGKWRDNIVNVLTGEKEEGTPKEITNKSQDPALGFVLGDKNSLQEKIAATPDKEIRTRGPHRYIVLSAGSRIIFMPNGDKTKAHVVSFCKREDKTPLALGDPEERELFHEAIECYIRSAPIIFKKNPKTSAISMNLEKFKIYTYDNVEFDKPLEASEESEFKLTEAEQRMIFAVPIKKKEEKQKITTDTAKKPSKKTRGDDPALSTNSERRDAPKAHGKPRHGRSRSGGASASRSGVDVSALD